MCSPDMGSITSKFDKHKIDFQRLYQSNDIFWTKYLSSDAKQSFDGPEDAGTDKYRLANLLIAGGYMDVFSFQNCRGFAFDSLVLSLVYYF